MKFSQTSLDDGYVITAYEPGVLSIRGKAHTQSLLLMPQQLLGSWALHDMQQLSNEHLLALIEHKPEIIIFGTGEKQVFPHPSLFSPLMDNGIGYEIMTTSAACRTYNILLSEDRQVLAALIVT